MPDYATGDTLVMKSIDYFNTELKQKVNSLRLIPDIAHFQLRIAKKKNGKPNTDYPSKSTFIYK